MSTKSDIRKFVSDVNNHNLMRMTFKFFNHSETIFHTHDVIKDMEGYIREIAQKNDRVVNIELQALMSESVDHRFYVRHKDEITNDWYTIAGKQYTIFTTTLHALELLLKTVDDDLNILSNEYDASVLYPYNDHIDKEDSA